MSKATKNINVTLSVSVKSVRVPVGMYEDMLLSDDEVINKIDGELYLGKHLVVADESIDEVDVDFECNIVDNDENLGYQTVAEVGKFYPNKGE